MKVFVFLRVKRKIEELLMFPFVLYGKMKAKRNPLSTEYDIFFFFPGYAMGGAERANLDIIKSFPGKKKIIFFTRKSKDDALYNDFRQNSEKVVEINKWTDNKLKYWDSFVYRGICAQYINAQKVKPVVFNGQCNFGYKLFPHLTKAIKKIELIHTAEKKFAWITFPYIEFIDKRVMVADNIISEQKGYYREIGIPSLYESKIFKILYTVPLVYSKNEKKRKYKLQVYYAGRGGYQKRLYLLFSIIKKCIDESVPVDFHMAGNFENEIPPEIVNKVNYYGLLKEKEMQSLHLDMDVLLMTSAFEGFPLVMMEAMAAGVVPVSTAVDGILEHITSGNNGLLILNPKNEEEVVRQGFDHLVYLSQNSGKLKEMSDNAFLYAQNNFSLEKFRDAYRKLVLDESL